MMSYAYSDKSTVTHHGLRNFASVFIAELTVIYTWFLFSSYHSKLRLKYTFCHLFLSRPFSSYAGPHSTIPTVQHILLLLHLQRLAQQQSPPDLPAHDKVDFAAKLSRLSCIVSNPLLTSAYKLENYHHSLILTSWWQEFLTIRSSNKLRAIKTFHSLGLPLSNPLVMKKPSSHVLE